MILRRRVSALGAFSAQAPALPRAGALLWNCPTGRTFWDQISHIRTLPHLVQRRMLDRTISELHVELFNQLRGTHLYPRLKSATVEPSDSLPCGWLAKVAGEFTIEEDGQVNDIVRELQRRYSLAVDPLRASRPSE